ncbi:MAG: CoA transferase [Thermoplasmata archaeon]|uniref:CoA transferase n=1 Tax=Candidatus Sysuiplasma superficiale TaxID=2823368 RepID=A0A8J7YXJ2_9ARCH|nr:CoA transferase [Candidatus Sysuiplasma superficiale]MBX8644719.1 CoA transferase [Candidatus Sysuiplasma superficiale]MCL5437240.1 CoA transferase [Candidatus Thermoplasmatota archaeon]
MEESQERDEGRGVRGALDGIRVIDFTRAMSGPFCTMLLGDLGADIVKVESAEGDDTRRWIPPEVGGMSTYFLSANRNKRSISIDLSSAEAREIVRRLVLRSDVIIENFRPGVAERLKIDYGTLSGIRKDVVYCSISGFGQDGPYRDRPGFDLTILALSGLMSLTGEPAGAPVKFGVPVTDINAGLFAAISILSALFHRERTGIGQYIDISMLDCSVLTLTHQALAYFATGVNPQRMGSAHPSIAPYQVYRTADGYVSVAVGSEKLWESFCSAIGMPELLNDPMFRRNSDRIANIGQLNSVLEAKFRSEPADRILKMLESAGIPAARINSVGDALKDPQVAYRGMISQFSHHAYGNIKSPGTPFRMSETPGRLRYAPPVLGEHTQEILSEIGYKPEDIKTLYNSGAVR